MYNLLALNILGNCIRRLYKIEVNNLIWKYLFPAMNETSTTSNFEVNLHVFLVLVRKFKFEHFKYSTFHINTSAIRFSRFSNSMLKVDMSIFFCLYLEIRLLCDRRCYCWTQRCFVSMHLQWNYISGIILLIPARRWTSQMLNSYEGSEIPLASTNLFLNFLQ